MKKLILFLMALLSLNALADEGSRNGRIFLMAGLTMSPSTTYNVAVSGSTTSSTSTSSDSSSFKLGGEYNYSFSGSPVSVSGIVDWMKYNYQTGGVSSDSHFSLMVMPRAETKNNGFIFWGGLAFGIDWVSIGSPTGTVGAYTVTTNSSSSGFAFSPRIGADYEFDPGKTLGLQLEYFSTSQSIPATISSNGVTVPLTNNITRSWWATSFRFGIQI